MKKKLLTFLNIYIVLYGTTLGQVTSNPIFPTSDNPITITYDATQGTGSLTGASKVYMHAGVILSAADGTNWEYSKGNWGQDDGIGLMTQDPMNPTRWTITITPRTYFNVPAGKNIYRIGIVFRNADGSKEGKNSKNQDIFLDLVEPGLYVKFINPTVPYIIMENGNVTIQAASSENTTLTLYENNVQLKQVTNTTILNHVLNIATPGKKTIKIVADNGMQQKESSFYIVSRPAVTIEDLPAGVVDGINYIDSKTVILSLTAPNKNYIYAIGDFTNCEIDPSYYLKKTSDGNHWWTKIENLTPQQEYTFQYLVDGNLKIADPLTEKILDPWNDQYIPTSVYPNIGIYPTGKTEGIVSTFQTNQPVYNWNTINYTLPEKANLVIYEILIRDFVSTHDIKTITDTLSYLKKLGINAIELMPIMEFESNESWGYNPSFYLAFDKYYGTKNNLKAFIDKAHELGIAVILDITLNHAYGKCPFVQLYWDNVNKRPAINNPWFNPIAKHPFNTGYDFNHESNYTKQLVDRVTSHWLKEYKVDGFRFDLSKGFTQKNTGDNVDEWSKYDASRIAILKRIMDEIWKINSKTYIILEHFAENSEEKELANYGMMLWGNSHAAYQEPARGNYGFSDMQNSFYTTRGWDQPHVISYMESHDEERLMYSALTTGLSTSDYTIKSSSIALDRMKLAATFFFLIPGPKMMWQFGELGYDFSINNCPDGTISSDCRISNKPIKWDYLKDNDRSKLVEVYRSLIKLKTNYNVFNTKDVTLSLTGQFRKITLTDNDMSVHIIGNFGINKGKMDPSFPKTGTWYEYFSGLIREVVNEHSEIELNPGEFRIYTTTKLPTPIENIVTGIEDQFITSTLQSEIYPNPLQEKLYIENPEEEKITIELINNLGIIILQKQNLTNAKIELDVKNIPSGIYFIQIEKKNKKTIHKLIKL